jgi:hypothetical protein
MTSNAKVRVQNSWETSLQIGVETFDRSFNTGNTRTTHQWYSTFGVLTGQVFHSRWFVEMCRCTSTVTLQPMSRFVFCNLTQIFDLIGLFFYIEIWNQSSPKYEWIHWWEVHVREKLCPSSLAKRSTFMHWPIEDGQSRLDASTFWEPAVSCSARGEATVNVVITEVYPQSDPRLFQFPIPNEPIVTLGNSKSVPLLHHSKSRLDNCDRQNRPIPQKVHILQRLFFLLSKTKSSFSNPNLFTLQLNVILEISFPVVFPHLIGLISPFFPNVERFLGFLLLEFHCLTSLAF